MYQLKEENNKPVSKLPEANSGELDTKLIPFTLNVMPLWRI